MNYNILNIFSPTPPQGDLEEEALERLGLTDEVSERFCGMCPMFRTFFHDLWNNMEDLSHRHLEECDNGGSVADLNVEEALKVACRAYNRTNSSNSENFSNSSKSSFPDRNARPDSDEPPSFWGYPNGCTLKLKITFKIRFRMSILTDNNMRCVSVS
jgi:hypothetical protein